MTNNFHDWTNSIDALPPLNTWVEACDNDKVPKKAMLQEPTPKRRRLHFVFEDNTTADLDWCCYWRKLVDEVSEVQ